MTTAHHDEAHKDGRASSGWMAAGAGRSFSSAGSGCG
jgi:hypothetical protein